MSTITSKSIIDAIIAGNGKAYEEDPLVVKIVEYENAFDGGVAWGVVWEGMDLDTYHSSPFIRNPRVIWEKEV
jgi:hypothetical protein